MPEEYDNDLLQEGILHFRAKEFALARRYFERALDAAHDLQIRAQANYYLSQVEDDPKLKRQFLEETLAIDMGHAGARRALAILDGKLNPSEIVNPEAVPIPIPGTSEIESRRFTCPRCGGRMVYSPDGTSLVCESCHSPQIMNSGNSAAEQDFFVAMANGKGFRKTISMKTFQCQGCGASFMLAPTELSAICAYCGSLHVVALEQVRELVEPDSIIPMAIDQKQAAAILAQWLAGKRIVPNTAGDSPRGIYQPVWAFNFIGSLPWSGRVIRNNQELPVSGECLSQFTNVCIPASTKLGAQFLELLPGYSLESAPAYDPRFLSGWAAQVYQTTMADAALEARRITVERICRDIHREHGHVIDLHYSTSAISITSYQLILLPVWLMSYSFKNQVHRVLINGQTGTVLGGIPRLGLKDRLENLRSA